MVVTIAIISVVSTFGVLGIKTAREEFKHHAAARLFASYAEKARADAIRRHARTGEESSIEIFGPETRNYAVTMDWGSGVVETRTFELDEGLTFDVAARKVSFDWRGRIDEAYVFQIKSAYLNKNLPVDISGSGDVTVASQHFPDQLIPPVDITEVSGDVAPDPSPTVNPDPEETPTPLPPDDPDATPSPSPTASPGNGNGNGGDNGNVGSGENGNPANGNSTPTPTPTPTPTDPDNPIPQCASMISPPSIELSQSDSSRMSGSATFSMVNASGVRIISASQAGNGNALNVSLSLQRIDGSGSSVVTVSTKSGAGNRGEFIVIVKADPSCGSAQQLHVKVNN